jgi:glycosyltransferase involved in cell wall biosynthesis
LSQFITISICIPAYQRPEALRRLLRSIQAQSVWGVEVIITDDGDAVNIYDPRAEFKDLNIVYIKNQTRRGYPGNLLFATRQAKGRYVWWMGDDDELDAGAVSRVVQAIASNPDFIWVNARAYGRDEPFVQKIQDGIVSDNNDVFLRIGPMLTFISSTIIRREALVLALDAQRIQKFHKSLFANFIIVADILLNGGACYVIANSCIVTRWPLPGDSWLVFQTFGVEFMHAMEFCEDRISRKVKHALVARNFNFLWKAMFVESARVNKDQHKDVIPMIMRFWAYPQIVFAVPMLLLPREVKRVIFSIYTRLT